MKSKLLIVLILMLLMLTIGLASPFAYAQTKPVPQAAGLRFTTLMQRYNGAEKKFSFTYEKAETDAQRVKMEHSAAHPARIYLRLFQALAERAKGTTEGAQALLQAIKLAQEINNAAAMRKSIDAMLASYINLSIICEAIPSIDSGSYVIGVPESYGYLRRIARQSTLPEARSLAMFSLASAISDDPYSQNAAREEARKLLATLKQDYAATPYARQAEGFVFQLDNLRIGMTAPEIEAVDAQGVAIKLSDYRGKVVVLDFWGFW